MTTAEPRTDEDILQLVRDLVEYETIATGAVSEHPSVISAAKIAAEATVEKLEDEFVTPE
jgi:hypothetical protein